MLQKGKSGTTSSSSITSSGGPDTSVQYVKGVGPRLGAVFSSRDIATVRDLMTFFPRAYEDRTRLRAARELKEGEKASVAVRVIGSRQIPLRSGKRMFEVRCEDESGPIHLKWFHAPKGMESRFTPGLQIIATGLVKSYMGRTEMVHPEITWKTGAHAGSPSGRAADAGDPHLGRIIPIYTEIEGIPNRLLRKVLWEALAKYGTSMSEDLPERFRAAHGLPLLSSAIRAIHFPEEAGKTPDDRIADLIGFRTPSHARLIYEEFFKFEYLVLRQRLRMERAAAEAFGPKGGLAAAESMQGSLPFPLTRDQQVAVKEILGDLALPHPMNRLIQGDVGSGKTAVAMLAASCVLAEGGQAALMAPTEILAEQHFRNAARLFGGKLNAVLLTGSATAAERKALLPRLAAGEPILLIGTHALLEDPVVFRNLAFILVDEQQRFGVEQRRTLRRKGLRKDPASGRTLQPHALVLSATPIPRTLALTAYGDLTVSSIKEMPPGRSPVRTHVVRGEARARAHERIREELRAGHQAYFIFPLVNESEAEGFQSLKSAVAEAERLGREVFPEFQVGLLHGQMKSDDKAQVMDRFARNETQILVSTTVVEVGVDVPNATVMAIEHAERFGLSQLHQLRGRVGRGAAQSLCFLFAAQRTGETGEMRLEVLEETNDGFKIAEADLEIRGPGEFLGTRQAGGLPFRLANLVRDREWLIKARDDATALLREDPDLERPEQLPLRRYYEREGSLQFERLQTS